MKRVASYISTWPSEWMAGLILIGITVLCLILDSLVFLLLGSS